MSKQNDQSLLGRLQHTECMGMDQKPGLWIGTVLAFRAGLVISPLAAQLTSSPVLCNCHHNPCSPYSPSQITHTRFCEDTLPGPPPGHIALSVTTALSIVLVALRTSVYFRREHELKREEIVQRHQSVWCSEARLHPLSVPQLNIDTKIVPNS